MSKKGGNGKGGFFDALFNNPFGGLFDFNGDGKEDWGEQLIGYKIFEEMTRKEKSGNDLFDNDLDLGLGLDDSSDDDLLDDDLYLGLELDDFEDKYDWRDYCEDGSEYGVEPQDYETEEEYEEALEEARETDIGSSIPVTVNLELVAGDEDEIKQSDYPNKRRYNAAVTLANKYIIYSDKEYEQLEKGRCRFIVEQGDTVIAANYLTENGEFLFSQAVKDNFELPITLPDEDEHSEFALPDILRKIEKKNIALALDVWAWCIEQFLPYEHYAPFSRTAMTDGLVDGLYIFSDEFKKGLINYLHENPDFRQKLIRNSEQLPNNLANLIVELIKADFTDTAKAMFEDGLIRAGGKWKEINKLIGNLILYAKNYDELETIEYIEKELLPQVKSYPDGMIQDEIEGWEKDIAEYKQRVERECEKYAYTRSNAWRKIVPNGEEYGLDPCRFDSEQEYLNAIQEEKYSWRKWCMRQDTLGLDVNAFETEDEYREAWRERRKAEQEKKREELQRQRIADRKQRDTEFAKDKTIYTYCGVKFPFAERPYSFRTEDRTIQIGDTVIVPLGEDNKETEGMVVSVGQYARLGVPFPVERTKFILRKIEKEE